MTGQNGFVKENIPVTINAADKRATLRVLIKLCDYSVQSRADEHEWRWSDEEVRECKGGRNSWRIKPGERALLFLLLSGLLIPVILFDGIRFINN